MFFIGGLEMFLALGDFDHVGGDLPVLVCLVGEVPLLVEGVGPVVAGAVEFSHQQNIVSNVTLQAESWNFCWSEAGARICLEAIIKLMNLNQLNFYHANPFYKQDFMPDRAWYNREARAYPSQMPSGKDFLPQNSRKHYPGKFNHSEVAEENILKSPEKFPFENRIAHNKTYMRSLNTIDIEGACSNTRVNQSIKNKYKAREQLNRQSQSMDMQEKTEEERRRDAAVDYYHTLRKSQLSKSRSNQQNESRVSSMSSINTNSNSQHKPSPSIQKDLSDQYKKFIMHNSSNKFHKDVPIVKESPHTHIQHYSTIDPSARRETPRRKYQEYPYPPPQQMTPGSRYQKEFSLQQQNSKEYQKIQQYEQEMNRYSGRSDVRKRSPTNLSLSFNLAGQNVVAG